MGFPTLRYWSLAEAKELLTGGGIREPNREGRPRAPRDDAEAGNIWKGKRADGTQVRFVAELGGTRFVIFHNHAPGQKQKQIACLMTASLSAEQKAMSFICVQIECVYACLHTDSPARLHTGSPAPDCSPKPQDMGAR